MNNPQPREIWLVKFTLSNLLNIFKEESVILDILQGKEKLTVEQEQEQELIKRFT
jgi:hypothetical protein